MKLSSSRALSVRAGEDSKEAKYGRRVAIAKVASMRRTPALQRLRAFGLQCFKSQLPKGYHAACVEKLARYRMAMIFI